MDNKTDVTMVSFGGFSLDIKTGDLRRDGIIIEVPPTPTAALLYLAKNEGRLVTRNELAQQLWGNRAAGVDTSLNNIIRDIRRALDESASAPRFITTVPRRGYRFNLDEPGDAQQENRQKPYSLFQVRPVVVAVTGSLGVLIAITMVWLAASTSVFSFFTNDEAAKIIAVETSVESGLDPDYPSLAIGLTDELIVSLIEADIPYLEVIQGGETFAGKSDFVLSSVYSADEATLRILVTLKTTNKKQVIWTSTFDGSISDVGALIAMTANSTASSIKSLDLD